MLPTPVPTRARTAVAVVFFINGAVLASWLPHIPDLKARLGISDGGLGLVLLGMAVGAVVALPVAGWLVGRIGSRAITSASALGLCATVTLPALTPNVALTVTALGLLGAWNATLDVAMNAHGVRVEEAYGRPIMSSFHALFSLGGLVGAGGAALAMSLGLGAAVHLVGVAGFSMGAAAIALGGLVPTPHVQGRVDPVFVRPPAALLGLGLLTFCALLAEGAMGDWTAVYLRDSLEATPALAATGFAAFSLTMAVGRFCGDGLASRMGAAALLRASGALAAAGLAVSLLIGHPSAAIVGFGLVGLGVANLIPILFSAAGRAPGLPAATALAAVATTGYCGYLAGPPLIGLTADVVGLPLALGIVCASCGLVAAGAAVIPRSSQAPASPRNTVSKASTLTAEAPHG
jgi:fucose permease